MCRLLGILSKTNVDSTWLRQFKNLAKYGKSKDGLGHQDGWGIVIYQNNNPNYLGREPTSAINDVKYDIAINSLSNSTLRTKYLVAHVRKASPGSEINLHNTHPFIYKNWTFCHNGILYDFKPHLQIPLNGTTDSEIFFKYILPSLLADVDKSYELRLRDSINDTKSFMKKYKALNFILTDGNNMFAYRDFMESEVSSDLITLNYCKTENEVIVCSEPLTVHLPEKEWEDLKNKQMLIVDKDLDMKILQL